MALAGSMARAAGAVHSRRWIYAAVSMLLLALASMAWGAVTTPAVGTPERAAVLDAARVPVEAELGVSVRFVVDQLRVLDDWALLLGRPVGLDGKPLDYTATPYAEAMAEGMFDDGAVMLLRQADGRWSVVAHVIGATDVPWVGWDAEYGAPAGVFPAAGD